MNILIVEDNPSHLKLAHLVLSSAGYDVNDADGAAQAFEAIKAEKPQLILLDLELPGMNGLALVRELKSDPETADIQVVAVTSYPERFPRSEALAAGCVAYIAKPINTRTLPSQLEALMK
ncbi:MAG TPA: response regulator [Verrucomicrobiae bacterium]|nr:response regulator [Verrucomicrobiae bacterium]